MAAHNLLWQFHNPERGVIQLPAQDADIPDYTAGILPTQLRKNSPKLPQLSELDVHRYFFNLSQKNYCIDKGFYPLGSCTMKYNPRINEVLANMAPFQNCHPMADLATCQGTLKLLFKLKQMLCAITGMADFSLNTLAGAHGEFSGMAIAKQYLESKGEKRHKVIVPDTAHGTNPCSAKMCFDQIVEVKSGPNGYVRANDIDRLMDYDTACIMMTNPNTLGLFEEDFLKIVEIVHAKGGLVYLDGANFNAIIGQVNLAQMGVDIMHLNLHKTCTTPHGGGGPGAGPIGVTERLIPFLPIPQIVEQQHSDGDLLYQLDENRPESIGRIASFHGNVGILIRAYAYLLTMGSEYTPKISEDAIWNANYIRESLKSTYYMPFDQQCMHECIFTDKHQKPDNITTMDIAKRLIDYGFHPPTIYFPIMVHGAMMVEPTETESKGTIDAFIAAMKSIAEEARNDPDILRTAPHTTPVSRLDEVTAARKPILTWRDISIKDPLQKDASQSSGNQSSRSDRATVCEVFHSTQ